MNNGPGEIELRSEKLDIVHEDVVSLTVLMRRGASVVLTSVAI